MIVTLLMVFFIVICFVLILSVLLQQGKGDMGLGGLGGGSQMLFGGSGGQEIFERATWVMGAIFIIGALGLAILKSKHTEKTRFKTTTTSSRQIPAPQPKGPVSK